MTSTCTGGMWSAATTSATCGQSYSSCQSVATWSGCPNEGIFLINKCSQRVQCTLSKTVYTAPSGFLLDDRLIFLFYSFFDCYSIFVYFLI